MRLEVVVEPTLLRATLKRHSWALVVVCSWRLRAHRACDFVGNRHLLNRRASLLCCAEKGVAVCCPRCRSCNGPSQTLRGVISNHLRGTGRWMWLHLQIAHSLPSTAHPLCCGGVGYGHVVAQGDLMWAKDWDDYCVELDVIEDASDAKTGIVRQVYQWQVHFPWPMSNR